MRWCKKSNTVIHGGVLTAGKDAQLAGTPCRAGIKAEMGERDMGFGGAVSERAQNDAGGKRMHKNSILPACSHHPSFSTWHASISA
jgi:hypothetical protein